MNRHQGWTLIELAIVMIIIGLILGAIIKGKAVITNARIKNIEISLASLAKAVYTYQERYHALPGDDDKAASTFTQSTVISNGNGNGIIEGDYKVPTNATETGKVWQHLRAAELINGALEDVTGPPNPFDGEIGIGSNVYGLTGLVIGFTNIPKEIAVLIDERNDDGLQNQGKIRQEPNKVDQTLINLLFSI
jgi:prepilin-type N-terminal cleavage/methylation domain-containing protein